MLICVDVDGVIADLHTEWYRRYNRDYQDSLTLERVTHWYLHRFVKPECGKKIYDYLTQPDLYEAVQPTEGSQVGVEELRSMGHRCVFVTSNTRGMTDQKWDWLVRHKFIPETRSWPEDVIVSNAKYLVDGAMLIDDRSEAIVDWINNRQKKAILFEYPHNQDLVRDAHSAFWLRCKRVKKWSQIVEYVRG